MTVDFTDPGWIELLLTLSLAVLLKPLWGYYRSSPDRHPFKLDIARPVIPARLGRVRNRRVSIHARRRVELTNECYIRFAERRFSLRLYGLGLRLWKYVDPVDPPARLHAVYDRALRDSPSEGDSQDGKRYHLRTRKRNAGGLWFKYASDETDQPYTRPRHTSQGAMVLRIDYEPLLTHWEGWVEFRGPTVIHDETYARRRVWFVPEDIYDATKQPVRKGSRSSWVKPPGRWMGIRRWLLRATRRPVKPWQPAGPTQHV